MSLNFHSISFQKHSQAISTPLSNPILKQRKNTEARTSRGPPFSVDPPFVNGRTDAGGAIELHFDDLCEVARQVHQILGEDRSGFCESDGFWTAWGRPKRFF